MGTSARGPRLPITPADDLLPLNGLEWQEFEKFCEDYVAVLAGTERVRRYGVRGQSQKGIDFFADEHGELVTYQCKRVVAFGVPDARKAIEATAFNGASRHVVLVSCEVGAAVRDLFLPLPGWEIRDVRDISRHIAMTMPRDAAERLIGANFGPQWTANFFRNVEAAAATHREVLLRYIDAVIATTNDLAIPGLPLVGRHAPLRLESVYITLRAAYRNRATGIQKGPADAPSGTTPLWFQDGPAGRVEPASFTLPDAFRREPRLVILGDPGSGKTTALQWLALQLAQAYRDGTTGELGPPRIPIFFRASAYLKAWAEQGRQPIYSYIGHHLSAGIDGDTLNAALRAAVAQHEVVLLVDGLDEIADLKDRYDIAREVDRFLDDWLPPPGPARDDGNRAVITSRIVGYSSAELKTDAVLMTIEPLGSSSVDQLCHLLMQALHGGDAEAEAKRLVAAIGRLRDLGYDDLAGTPLLVTILALIYEHKRGELPTKRLALYSVAVDVVIDRWLDRVRTRGSIDLPVHEVRALFARLAEEMLDRAVVRLSEEDLETFLRRLTGGCPIDSLKAMLRDDVGLLMAQGEGWYSFLHATFQEYLGASSLMRDPERAADRIWEKKSRPRWALATVMAIGMSGDDRAFIESLLSHDRSEDGILPTATLLIAAAIPEMDSPPAGVHERLAEELVHSYARNIGLGRPQTFAAALEDAARLLARGGSRQAVAETFHQALRKGCEANDAAVAVAVARLTSAASCETANLARALLSALPMDSEEWNWPIDTALRDIADRSPNLLPRHRESLRAQLMASPELADAFTNDAGWRRIGLALYGGQDNGLHHRIAAATSELARLRADLAALDQSAATATSPQRRTELTSAIEQVEPQLRNLRDQGAPYSVQHFHRESQALTPLILSALNDGRDAESIRQELERMAASAGDLSTCVDARVALIALGCADAERWIRDETGEPARRTRAALRRMVPYISDSLVTALKKAADALRTAAIPADRLRDEVSLLADIAHAFRIHLSLFNPPAKGNHRWIAEALRLGLDPRRPDPQYNMAVVLDTAGGILTSEPLTLPLALAMAPHSMTASWGARTEWRLDPLAPIPSSQRDCLGLALDATEAIPSDFDYVRSWAIAAMAPLLQQEGLAPEAFIQLAIVGSDEYGARDLAIQRLVASSERDFRRENLLALAARIDDPWLRFRALTLLLRKVPASRHPATSRALIQVAEQIENPALQCRAFEKLHALEWPGGDWASRVRALAADMPDLENKALTFARVARFSHADRMALLREAWSAAMQLQPPIRADVLRSIRDITTAEERAGLSDDGLDEWERRVVEKQRRIMLAEYEPLLREARVDTAVLLLGATLTDLGLGPEDPAELAKFGRAPLSTRVAAFITSLLDAGDTTSAARILRLSDAPEAAAEGELRQWLRSNDPDVRRHAALLLVELGDYSAEPVKAMLELLDSSHDRSRFRAALALHGDFNEGNSRITTDQTGAQTLEVLGRAVLERGPFEPGVSLHLSWTFERVAHTDEQAFVRWLEASRGSDRNAALAQLILEDLNEARPAVWPVILDGLKGFGSRTEPVANRSLLRGFCRLAARGSIPEAAWREAIRLLIELKDECVSDDSFLFDAPGAIVDVAEELDDDDHEPAAIRCEAKLESRRRTINGEIHRLASAPDALRSMLQDVGTLRIVNDPYRATVTAAALRVVERPVLLAPLLEWTAPALDRPRSSYYDFSAGDLLSVVAEAAQHVPDVFLELAAKFPDLREAVVRAARTYPSFPARQSAFTLLGLMRHMTAQIVEALQLATHDVFYVQQAALASLDRYQSVEPTALDDLIQALGAESATFAYWCASVLNTLARNSRLDAGIRERIIAAFQAALDDPLSARDVFVLAWNQKQNEEKALTIEYRDTLRHHLARWLGELSGTADLVRAAMGHGS